MPSYICWANIRDYKNFGPGSCPLYDNEVPLAVRHAHEVKAEQEWTVALLVAQHPQVPETKFCNLVPAQMRKLVK
jgi:hypothetical protein